MTKSIKTFTAAGLALLVLGSSCKKLEDFGTTNADPSAVTSPYPYALLTNVEWQLGGFANNNRAQVTVQYFSEAEYPTFGLYAVPQVDFAATYSSLLFDLQTVINTGTSTDAERAMARIMKAYIFWTITDRWGPIPYTNALKLEVPDYTSQEVIYKDMIKELTEATAQMPASGSQRGDILYNSDFSKWKKLAGSLRALMALRLSKVYPAAGGYAATEFNAAIAAGVIDDNSSNLKVSYVGGGGTSEAYSNPFWYTNLQARDNGLSQPIYNMMAALGDPRANVFGSSSTAVPYGYSEGQINTWRQSNTNWARVFDGPPQHPTVTAYRGQMSPVYIVTAAEVYLARAEAADRGWTGEDMNAMYTAGVTAAFTQWGLAAPSAGYLANANVALTAPAGTAANLKNIANQFYLAAFPDGTQGWSNWRRTGFPVLTPTPAANCLSAAHTTIPRRYTYGALEYSNNLKNVTDAIGTIPGGDVQESRVWWDTP